MKTRLLTGIALLLVVAGVLAYTFRGPLALRLMERVVARNLASNLLDELPPGLHVGLCGAGSPLPDAERSGPCVAVVAGRRLFVVDSGSGASRNLSRMRLPPARTEAIFLTHFHSDHIDGLGELLMQRWAGGGHASPAPVHGPDGVGRVVAGFNEAYAQDFTYRVAHHGADVVRPSGAGGVAVPFTAPADGEGRVVFEADGLVVTAFRVDHTPVDPAVGYRFDYGGRSVLISGDTAKSANLARFAKGVDLLVHEALSPRLVDVLTRGAAAAGSANIEKITVDIVDYHATPVDAAEIARDAGAGHLLLYHIVPPLPVAPLAVVFLDGVDAVYDGPVTVGRDGVFFSMPKDSRDIECRDLL
jgi:ribonuclease Z